MYKIYINQSLILLQESSKVEPKSSRGIVLPFGGKANELLKYVDLCEKSSKPVEVVLYHEDVALLYDSLASLFVLVPAAGGVTRSPQGLALIHRLGFWDLPKGKIEKGETPSQAALREVEEEIGVHSLRIQQSLPSTFHVYRDRKDRRVLKKTFWFLMDCPAQELTPQVEEEIEQARWLHLDKAINQTPMYNNILNVLFFCKKITHCRVICPR